MGISSSGLSLSLTLHGTAPTGPVLFEVPVFVDNVATTSVGRIIQATGTVTVPPSVRHVTITLRRAPELPAWHSTRTLRPWYVRARSGTMGT